MAEPKEMMIAIGPAELIRRNFREALRLIESTRGALTDVLNPRLSRVATSNTEDALSYLETARDLLAPIFKAIDGRSPPPPRTMHRLTAAQRKAAEQAARILMDSAENDSSAAETLQ